MSNGACTLHNDLFSSLISDIKTYTGKDPLLPWLRGIRKIKESLPPQLVKEKLPRFLQKCAQTFENDRRYANDLRYLRVWLQLMDFVDDPKGVLRTMEANHIGMKKSLFYQAYALYYEKLKKFDKADKMYHLGVQNLAEPIEELQKSYEQFLHRVEQHKKKKFLCKERILGKRIHRVEGLPPKGNDDAQRNIENINEGKPAGTQPLEPLPKTQPNIENVKSKVVSKASFKNETLVTEPNHSTVAGNMCNFEIYSDSSLKNGVTEDIEDASCINPQNNTKAVVDESGKFCSDDTVVVRFVDTAIVGKSEAEDAWHHGLVEPTINTKEALNAINNMFREPLEPALVNRRSHRSQPKADQRLGKEFEVFIDNNLDEGGLSNQHEDKGPVLMQHNGVETKHCLQEPLQIFIDEEESNEVEERINAEANLEKNKVQQPEYGNRSSAHVNAFVFPSPKDLPSECSMDLDAERSPRARFREDTVVCRFVGATISDEPQVENVCHHGLVEPTINLKEAMSDINSMFGKPIDFLRTNRRRKQDKAAYSKNNSGGFLILPDDDLDNQLGNSQPSSTAKNESDLYEPTMCTKEAMNDINKMFAMPLDF